MHILLGTPCGQGGVTRQYLSSVLALKDRCAELGWSLDVVTVPDALVTRSRNTLASLVAQSDRYTHLLMADADIGFEPEVIERLVTSGHDVVGACVPLRQVRWSRVRDVLDLLPDLDAPHMESVAHRLSVTFLREPKQPMTDGFLPVRYLGGALMLTTKAALDRVASSPEVSRYATGGGVPGEPESGWTFFDPLVDDQGLYLSEDFAFCLRWRSLGGDVWADMRSAVTHTGVITVHSDIALTLETARTLVARRSDQ